MALSRYKLGAQLLTLGLLIGLALWEHLMRHYDLILPPTLLAIALLIAIPLQWLGHLGETLADRLLLVGGLILCAVEAPGSATPMLWLGLSVTLSFLLLTPLPALLLSLAIVPALLYLLGDAQMTLFNLALGWWLTLAAAVLTVFLDRSSPASRFTLTPWRRDRRLSGTGIRESLKIEVARATELHRPLSVLVVYIPQLDQASDQFGSHLREILSASFSDVVSNNSRQSDLLGEHRANVFWLMLPNAAEPGAIAAAKRLSDAVTAITHPEIGSLESYSRVCTLQADESAERFLQRLEAAANKLLEPHA
ncbi:diguanylate cyclase domain-containing protein [Salinicola halimionae]|uniref:diguanylate cyclase domain-containing protein n=1 Tax=Salinicola halimionae TaxID=1949081 RepID=UPI0013009A89|nr:diguanylate cyclase [Salinicola halimionae]